MPKKADFMFFFWQFFFEKLLDILSFLIYGGECMICFFYLNYLPNINQLNLECDTVTNCLFLKNCNFFSKLETSENINPFLKHSNSKKNTQKTCKSPTK